MMTIADVIDLSPEVGVVLARAQTGRGRYWQAYTAHKRELSRLVGHDAALGTPDVLCTCEAYDAAIGALCEVLERREEMRA